MAGAPGLGLLPSCGGGRRSRDLRPGAVRRAPGATRAGSCRAHVGGREAGHPGRGAEQRGLHVGGGSMGVEGWAPRAGAGGGAGGWWLGRGHGAGGEAREAGGVACVLECLGACMCAGEE